MGRKILSKPLKIRTMGNRGAEVTFPAEMLTMMKLKVGDYISFDYYVGDNIDENYCVIHKKEHEINLVEEKLD